MKVCRFSNHIPMSSLSAEELDVLLSDIRLFNTMKRTAVRQLTAAARYDDAPKKQKDVDLRKSEFASIRDSLPPSRHMLFKQQFQTEDHFTNSALQSASAAVKSTQELVAFNQSVVKDKLANVRKKIKSHRATLTKLTRMKDYLIKRSYAVKYGQPLPKPYKDGMTAFPADGTVRRSYRINKKDVVVRWDNVYDFEVQFVTPRIKETRKAIAALEQKKQRLEVKIHKISQPASICFGQKEFFRKQNTVYSNDHDTWRRCFDKRRNHSMVISGRKDAFGGNFLFRYDSFAHTLVYRSQCGKTVTLSNVFFPYGQADVDAAVTAPAGTRQAVAWSIEVWGKSFVVKCMVGVDYTDEMNDYYGDGCVSFDTNYDNLSVTSLDGSGNILGHRILHFNLEGLSSGQTEQVLSQTLDQIIQMAETQKKPLAMEDLKIKQGSSHYGNRKTNRKLSSFAYRKITALAESKAIRHNIHLCKVDPRYTSQIGKIKFMRKHGLSVHEAAAAAIGRRALGIHEKIPKVFWSKVPVDKESCLRINQWKAIYPVTKKIHPKDMYGWDFTCNSGNP